LLAGGKVSAGVHNILFFDEFQYLTPWILEAISISKRTQIMRFAGRYPLVTASYHNYTLTGSRLSDEPQLLSAHLPQIVSHYINALA
jgi:hypothetical protein